MHGWTDPMDPNGAPRRAERPTDEPDWLRDRPEPRSAYLFGDDPDQPGDGWHHTEPTSRWQPAPMDEPTDAEAIGGWAAPTSAMPIDAETSGAWRAGTGDEGRPGEGRHRSPRRWRRPLLIGGAAAAATLVVSFGVGALACPAGTGRQLSRPLSTTPSPPRPPSKPSNRPATP